jgi:Ran GTPase-activating protein (RanGAP) involved in mRNA processing and transport
MASHPPFRRIQTRLKPKLALQSDPIVSRFDGGNYRIASDIFYFNFLRGFMPFSTRRLVNSSPPFVSGIPAASETPIESEKKSEEQIHPADRHFPQFDSHGENAFLDSNELKLIDPKILTNFIEGKIPRDEKILGTIAMYALQHEPNVFLWLIGPHSGVTSLSFESREMGDDLAEKLVKLLQGSQSLTSLSLKENKLSAKGAKNIFQALSGTALKSLNLASNNIRAEGAAAIAEVLPRTILTSLDLQGCSIGNVGAATIAQILPNTFLISLNLATNDIGAEGAMEIAKTLANTVLTSLDFHFNVIGDDGAAAIAAVLPDTALTSLDLEISNIGDAGAAAIAKVLSKTALTSLCLPLNNIGNAGVAAIAKELPHSALTSLDLNYANIDSTGVATIAEALPNTALNSLSLGGSRDVGVEGARVLATSLQGNKTLTSLTFMGNNIGNEGAAAIADALPHTILISLYLIQNNIGTDGATAIANALKNNSTLTALDLFDYNLPKWKNSEAVKTIKQEIKMNQFLKSPERENTLQQLSPIFTGNIQVDNNMLPELPKEIALEIFKYMDHENLAKMKTVHRLNPIGNDDMLIESSDTHTTQT